MKLNMTLTIRMMREFVAVSIAWKSIVFSTLCRTTFKESPLIHDVPLQDWFGGFFTFNHHFTYIEECNRIFLEAKRPELCSKFDTPRI